MFLHERMTSQGTAPTLGLDPLEGDIVSPLARRMSEKEEWAFVLFFLKVLACLM